MAQEKSPSGLFGGLAQLGRYFQLIAVVPAFVVVVPVFALVAAGAPGRRPDIHVLARAAATFGLKDGVLLSFATVVVGMSIHPFQFPVTQWLEGYWGPRSLGRAAMISRTRIHAQRQSDLVSRSYRANRRLKAMPVLVGLNESPDGQVVAARIDSQEFATAARQYPSEASLLPTRLGNTLRRFEDQAGAPYGYGTDGSALVSHLVHLGAGSSVAEVNDARVDLDLAVRFVICWSILAVALCLLLWQYDVWLLYAGVAYLLACLSYRGACHSATLYGHALLVLFDINHHLLLTPIVHEFGVV